jgi:N-acetylglucosaminyltransferase
MPAIGSSILAAVLPCLAAMYVWLASVSGVLQRNFARRAPVDVEPEPVAEPEPYWPSVDVVVPCFNEDPDVLRHCLDSILGQSYEGSLRLWVSALEAVYD